MQERITRLVRKRRKGTCNKSEINLSCFFFFFFFQFYRCRLLFVKIRDPFLFIYLFFFRNLPFAKSGHSAELWTGFDLSRGHVAGAECQMRACTYVHGNESILRSLPSRLAEVVKDIRYSRANRSNNVSVPRISRVPVRFFLFFFIKQEKMSISPGDVGLICGGRRCNNNLCAADYYWKQRGEAT